MLTSEMNHVDSDLEEGEILDDSPSLFHPVKRKELPRRYVLDSSKHKKHCKYSIRHHAKKLSKKKNMKTKVKHKLHHKSCSHDKLYKASCSSSSISDGVFKDYSIISPNVKSNRPQSQKILSKTENLKILNESSFAQMLEKYKAMQSSKNTNNFISSTNQVRNTLVKSIEGLKGLEKECDKITKKTISNDLSNGPEVIVIDDDEDDDEEELRRIALATCANRVMSSEQPLKTLECDNICATQSINHVYNLNYNIGNQVSDNYEVVDMEVDEDNSPDITKNLFVIDTKPSSGYQNNLNSLPEVKANNCIDDDSDFEADMLRAELINGMFQQKKSVSDKLMSSKIPQNNLPEVQASLLKPVKQIFTENSKQNSKPNLDKPLLEKKSTQRFIISLNGESSSEESDEDINTRNVLPENPMASIEALISDIRQQSDCNKKDKVVPKAVSCLSKGQQEEYNALVKILTDKKRSIHVPQDEPEVKNKIVHSPMDDLKLYEKKLMGVKEDLKRQKNQMAGLSKQVTAKKQVYLKAKLNVQSLKEKLVAAEKIRRIKLDAWSKSCKNFESVKRSVADLELKIINLQDLCSKVGSSIQGRNYSLPSSTES